MNLASIVSGHPPDTVALIGRTGETTYGDLVDQVARLRSGLVERGVRRGDHVAVIAANNELFVTALLAIVGAGAVAAPLNPANPPAELARELDVLQPTAVIAGPAGARSLAGIDPGALANVKVIGVAEGSAPDGLGTVSLVELAGGGARPVIDVADDDPAIVLFTSGTSGVPRGAVLTHGQLLVNHEQVLAADPNGVVPDDVVLGVLPLFHVFGLNVVLGLTLRVGATLVLDERFDAERTLELLARHAVSVVAAGPPVWNSWAALPHPHPALAGLRRALSGAAALPRATAERFEALHGVGIREGYGLTEAAPVVTMPPADQYRPGSVGRPVPELQLRLVDDEGEDAFVGDPGEVWVRGPNVFAGYLDGGPSCIDDDGWLHTGDIAVMDDDGWLWLVDRLGDLIIVSGFNVYPAEVENVLDAHPAVAAVAVVGEPDDRTGERIVAHVEAAAGALIEEHELLFFAAERLPRFKCPVRIDVHDALPAGATGKTLKRLLRDR